MDRMARGLETLWRDGRYALRNLRRRPGFALVIVLTIVVRRLRAASKPVEVDADALADAKNLLEEDEPEK